MCDGRLAAHTHANPSTCAASDSATEIWRIWMYLVIWKNLKTYCICQVLLVLITPPSLSLSRLDTPTQGYCEAVTLTAIAINSLFQFFPAADQKAPWHARVIFAHAPSKGFHAFCHSMFHTSHHVWHATSYNIIVVSQRPQNSRNSQKIWLNYIEAWNGGRVVGCWMLHCHMRGLLCRFHAFFTFLM